jgi:hypothetical protein
MAEEEYDLPVENYRRDLLSALESVEEGGEESSDNTEETAETPV